MQRVGKICLGGAGIFVALRSASMKWVTYVKPNRPRARRAPARAVGLCAGVTAHR